MKQKMKRYSTIFCAAALVLLCSGCGKDLTIGKNDAEKMHFDAWISVNAPKATRVEPGIYIMSEDKGSGEALGSQDDSPYILVEYSSQLLNGVYTGYTTEELARRIGTYSPTDYYGPVLWTRKGNGLTAGLDAAVSRLNVGGSTKAIIPGWLLSFNRYPTEKGYLDNESGTDGIFDIKVCGKINDLQKWELDSLITHVKRVHPEIEAKDSLKNGFYYIQRKASKTDKAYGSTEKFYINYIGRRLDGVVFDTNVADTAKKYDIYSSKKTYKPSVIARAEKYSEFTMASSSLIDGFAYALYQMKPFEQCTVYFLSKYGYKETGSKKTIPAYSPLRFDIDIVTQDGKYE